MKPKLAAALCCAIPLAAFAAPKAAQGYNYPTADRVVYVQECMRQHPGPEFEMLSKCACTLDKLAKKLPHEQFVAMTTATNATSIGGERGSYIRDTEILQKQIRQFRDLQSAAKKSCFILSEPVR